MKIFKFIGKLIGIVLALFVVVIIIGVVVDDDESKSTTTKTVKTKKSKGPIYTLDNPNPISDFRYEFTEDQKAIDIKSYVGDSSTVVFPESIEGYPVRRIDSILSSEKIYKNIIVPKSVKELGQFAFSDVKGNINIDLTNLQYIGEGAFSGSDLTGTVIISKNCIYDVDWSEHLKTFAVGWGDRNSHCFAYSKVTSVIIEEGVTILPDAMFYSCEELKSVKIPSSLKYIGDNAFSYCNSLTEVIFADGQKIKYENDHVFEGCDSLSLATRTKLIQSGYDGRFTDFL